MFDSLKKRLKDALSKASAIVKEKEVTAKAEEAIPQIAEPSVLEMKEETIARPEELREPTEEPKDGVVLPEPIKEIEPVALPKPTEEKKSVFQRIVKRVVEKKLTEGDVEPIMTELKKALLENDVALDTAEKICEETKAGLVGKDVSRGKVEDTIRGALRVALLDAMKQENVDLDSLIEKKWKEEGMPYLMMFLGFNGTGKTTSMSKLAHRFKKYKPVLAAGDTFRAASIEQLEEHARRLGAELVKHKYGADSAAVIFDAVKHASAKGCRLVLADTAGRSHSNTNLMDELKKVVRVNKPDLKILVLDSLTGNDVYDQSRLFSEAVGVDAIILTKADVYEKGGAALSASHTIKKPILFLGTGQDYGDLKKFDAEEIVKNLLE